MERIDGIELSALSETLLIPLWFRALESREKKPIVLDRSAEELMARLPGYHSRLPRRSMDRVFTLLRCRRFDACATGFLDAHPDGLVVEIGCGLDDRMARVDNGRARWIDLDLPEVMRVRDELLGPTAEEGRRQRIAASVLDDAWLDRVPRGMGERLLFLAEGVLMYFEPAQVVSLFQTILDAFPGCGLVCDVLTPFLVRRKQRDSPLREAAGLVRWSLREPSEPEAWGPGIRLVERWNYFERLEPRLGLGNLFGLVPPFRDGAHVLTFRLGGS